MKHVKVTELRQKLPEYMAKVRRRRALPRHFPGPGHRRDRSARGREGRSGGGAGAPARTACGATSGRSIRLIDPGEWDANK